MEYILMHKNVPIADLEIGDLIGKIKSVAEVYNINHAPVGTIVDGNLNAEMLDVWWCSRAIPLSRKRLDFLMSYYNVISSYMLSVKSFGLSLSDQYWICPVKSDINWESINFFDNDFSDDIGNILFGAPAVTGTNPVSPDSTSDGWLPKKWIIRDGKRLLMKGGSGEWQQEPINEIVASMIADKLCIDHVDYSIIWENDLPYSMCGNFTSRDTELISANFIMQYKNFSDGTSRYEHYINCCKKLGVKDIASKLNEMIVLDFIISNLDRHLGNFGIIRNADTLECINTAPLFDNGSSMWYDIRTSRINKWYDASKTFKHTNYEQLELVTSFDFIDFNNLSYIPDICNDIYKSSYYISDERRGYICQGIELRIKQLKEYIKM